MSKQAMDLLRQKYTHKIAEFLQQEGEEVLVIGTNELAIPCVDSEGNDQYCCFVVKVPTGSRDGDAYDAYGLAQEFEMKQKEKAEKNKEKEIAKAKKIARDEEMRRQKAEAKAKAKERA
jgi:hypothetical protein